MLIHKVLRYILVLFFTMKLNIKRYFPFKRLWSISDKFEQPLGSFGRKWYNGNFDFDLFDQYLTFVLDTSTSILNHKFCYFL